MRKFPNRIERDKIMLKLQIQVTTGNSFDDIL